MPQVESISYVIYHNADTGKDGVAFWEDEIPAKRTHADFIRKHRHHADIRCIAVGTMAYDMELGRWKSLMLEDLWGSVVSSKTRIERFKLAVQHIDAVYGQQENIKMQTSQRFGPHYDNLEKTLISKHQMSEKMAKRCVRKARERVM